MAFKIINEDMVIVDGDIHKFVESSDVHDEFGSEIYSPCKGCSLDSVDKLDICMSAKCSSDMRKDCLDGYFIMVKNND